MTVQELQGEMSAAGDGAGDNNASNLSAAPERNTQYGWKTAAKLSYDMDNPPPLTVGEKWFNGLNWWGIGWGSNVAVSLWAADKMEAGSTQPVFNSLTDKLARTRAFSWLEKYPGGMPRKWSRSIASLMILMGGGFAVMVPMKFAEDNKRWWVKKFDNLFGKTESQMTPDELKLKNARYEYLEHEPHQSWGTMLGGRIYTLVPVLAAHYSLAQKNNIANLAFGKEAFKGLAYHWGQAGELLQVGYRKAIGAFGEGAHDMAKIADKKSSYTWIERAFDPAPQKQLQLFRDKIANGTLDAFEHAVDGVPKIWKKGTPIESIMSEARSREGLIFEPKTGAERVHGILTNGMVDTFYSGGVATGTFLMAKSFANDREGVGKKAQKERMEIAKRMGVPYEEVPSRQKASYAAYASVDGQPPSDLDAQAQQEIAGRAETPSMTVGEIEEYIASRHAQGQAAQVGA